MWLYLIVLALVLVGVVGGILSGFAFTIILVAVAAIVLVAGAVFGGAGAVATRKSEADGVPQQPLPTGQQRESGRVPTSPERLTDARRARQ
jgi:hypothetical protein